MQEADGGIAKRHHENKGCPRDQAARHNVVLHLRSKI